MCDRYRADVASPSSWYRWYREPGSVLPGTDLENFPGVSRTSRAGPRCDLPRRACLALVRYHWPVTRSGGGASAGTRRERLFSSGTEPGPSRDYVEASHSHERHTVHGLHKHKSHEQDVPCGDGNKGCRLCSSGQSFQPIDKPARYRQNLYCVDAKEVRHPKIAPRGAPVDHRQPGTLRRNAHHTLSLRHHHPPDGGSCKEKEKPECDPELR